MILTVIGARPQFIKAAPVSQALQSAGVNEVVLHTGQHFDHEMDRVFFDELGMSYPTHNLQAGGHTHATQTAQMLKGVEEAIIELKPSLVLVYGDTNSTLAAALAAAKMHVPIAHVEAGLRSYNMQMPEEVNRRLTDHVSSFLFCPSDVAANNLQREGITEGIHVVGDVMLDAFQMFRPMAEKRTLPEHIEEPFYLFTLHRPSNVDDTFRLQSIVSTLSSLNDTLVWPVHPRVKEALSRIDIPQNVRLLSPQPYLTNMRLLMSAKALITDSGGMQKEAYWAKTPCITLREETEWTETLENGWNQLVVNPSDLTNAINNTPTTWKPLYGDGQAAAKIVDVLGQIP